MNDREFNAEIKKGLSGGYLFFGDEEYLKEYAFGKAKEAVLSGSSGFEDFNYIKIDEDKYSPQALKEALSTCPMMAEKVFVRCNINLSKLKEDETDRLLEVLEELEEYSAVLVLYTLAGCFDAGNLKNSKPTSLYKKLTQSITPVEFSHQPTAVLKKWILRRLAADEITASDTVLSRLCEICDSDMTALKNECEKLICFAKEKGECEISTEAVSLLCAEYGEAGTFDLTNAIVSGNKTLALDVLREYRDKRRGAVSVLAGIIADFSNMLKIGIYMKEGLYKADISAKTGMHTFRVGRYMEAAQGKELAVIRGALERCREADLALKSSGVDYIALERLVCTMPGRKYSRQGW